MTFTKNCTQVPKVLNEVPFMCKGDYFNHIKKNFKEELRPDTPYIPRTDLPD